VVLMAVDPLERVLQLVADGRLTAEEAGPILAALDDRGPTSGTAETGAPGGPTGAPTPPARPAAPRPPIRGDGSLRLEVVEHGRQVVNLRLPLAVGRLALDRVPGLSGEQVDRVREALSSGMHGPILVVEDDESSVRIVVE
jgi:hypothetical protein